VKSPLSTCSRFATFLTALSSTWVSLLQAWTLKTSRTSKYSRWAIEVILLTRYRSSIQGEERHEASRRQGPSSSDNGDFDPVVGGRDSGSTAESLKRILTTDGEGSLFNAVKHRKTNVSTADWTALIQRILVLERQLAASYVNGDDTSVAGKASVADLKSDLDVIPENGFDDSGDQPQIIPQLIERSWSDFMNKDAKDYNEYAMEILPEEPEYYHAKKFVAKGDRKHGKNRATAQGVDHKAEHKIPKSPEGQRPVPARIRINSTAILKTLKTYDDNIDDTASAVFLRPFKCLVHYDLQIREFVRGLERLIVDQELNTHPPDVESAHPFAQPSDKEIQQETLQHMRCLIDFMDRYLKPTVSHIAESTEGKISFMDLWYLFKPGDNIYMPLNVQDGSLSAEAMGATPETFQGRYNQLWRVTGVSGGRPNISAAQDRNANLKPNPFKVDCYYIDFHGRFFRPVVHTFEIIHFKGQREIGSLEFFPVRFMSPEQQAMRSRMDQGKMIFESISHSFTHFFYSGPMLMVHPCGCPMENGPVIQEQVESEVIVDFKMAFNKHPSWKPEREPWKDPVIQRSELRETFPVHCWADSKRTKLARDDYDQVYNDYFIDRERSIVFRHNEAIFAPIPSGWISNEKMVPDGDMMLLPGRVFAFVLRTRSFGE
jgi:hypothetical protein